MRIVGVVFGLDGTEYDIPRFAAVTILDVWDRGAGTRYQKAKSATISEMIQDHPSIVSETCPFLLRRDYGFNFPSSMNASIDKWPGLATISIQIAQRFNTKQGMKKILRANSNMATEVHKHNKAWMLLPSLVRCFAESQKGVANRDVCLEDIAESFILHIGDADELETKQAELHFILKARDAQLRPYAIKCGSL
ncbi:hypothetical protein QAD02_013920 [Eretmocerus hayati]|uniref:Uncharacterized protein n=1 Tax=Eretmocerus hayati TaxID=131215 RepID=A0ACC2P4X9_9HYME|nr:hypothetical protein QAD02_013920 [Eretmocerus hayati]